MLKTSFAAAASILIFAALSASAQDFSDLKSALVDYSSATIEPRKTCEQLQKFKSKQIAQISSVTVPAGDAAPAFCRVTGVLSPEIAFEVDLPAKWNGRFYMIGNGGFAGDALDNPGRVTQRDEALKLGFAFAQTNTGHDSRKETGATFVLSNPQKAIDYAYRAVHLTATTAKDITNEYYAKPIYKAYWNSCSNGGRQGLIEAQRFPEDFDGIVANSPWVDQTGYSVAAIWNQKAISAVSLTPAKLALVADKVIAKCDAIDGLKDGLIDDPRKCDFNPARDVPACSTGANAPDCLTTEEAAAIEKVYSGPISKGQPFFPGFMPGSEAVVTNAANGASASSWLNLIVASQPDRKPADFNLGEGTIRYLVPKPPKPDYDYQTFNFDADVHLLDDWSKLADAKNPDLSKFKKRDGKLLMTYGWADPVLQPMMGVHYYERAVAKNGPETTEFLRLFMIPGMSHCRGGVGPDQRDEMTAMIDWVEKGKAPDSIVASKIVDKQITRTRPLCPYPQVARYSGQGSIDEAANFHCVAP